MDITIDGVPLHPLVVHLSVVAVPLAGILALVWTLGKARLATLSLAVSWIAAAATLLAKISGERLLEAKGLSEHNPGPVADHVTWATYALASIATLAVFSTFGRSIGTKSGAWIWNLTRMLIILAALASVLSIVIAGHEGAKLVWTH
ncbi:DUF2231 domain-containing protein [Corynebacterium pelargi]|uniref:Uncharacterized protein n=1 Tax=Corynebacterium pelargi TaxID=1471400 RepID=A0A410W8N4_9CORY|nr:DUF2231 domain-containing protein [Corynebacterium pelargi]QAU52306.1 hypothetical protein CPELA_05170 [Corynebacterium pelargi]GGG68588.1 hypothetical protein GCM10007338_01610 [Corynebacterium pelargi]